MFRAREVTILEQSMINGGIDTSTGIGRYFLNKLCQAEYSQDEVKVNSYCNESKVVYMATLTIEGVQNAIAEVWWQWGGGTGQRDRWHIAVNRKNGRASNPDLNYNERGIFSQYDLAGKRMPDV